MIARIDIADPRVRRWAPVGAVLLAGALAVAVPDKSIELLSGTTAVITTTPASTTSTSTAPAADAGDVVAPVPTVATPPPTFGSDAAPATPTATAAAPASTTSVSQPPARVASASPVGPLRVVRHTWAQSATRRGTPVETAPAGSMPVAAFAGGADRASYVELDGADAILTLAVYRGDDSPDSLAELASVVACPIISAAWEPEDGQSFASAPVHDPEHCVDGKPAGDGAAWSWDLAAFPDRARGVGFALVPTSGGTGTWHITFASHA
jgi:hypothetical protein